MADPLSQTVDHLANLDSSAAPSVSGRPDDVAAPSTPAKEGSWAPRWLQRRACASECARCA